MIWAAVISGPVSDGSRSFSTISRDGQVDRLTVQGGEGRDPDEGTFEFPDVAGDLGGDVLEYLGRCDQPLLDALLAEDGDARLEVGRLNVGDQPPLEAGAHAGPRSRASCFGGRSEVTTICLLELCSVLKVWKNSSCVWILPPRNWMSSTRSTSTSRYRRWKLAALSSRMLLMNSLVNSSELDVAHPGALVEGAGVVPDGVQQMGLSESGAAVDEQRVVGTGRLLGDCDGGSVREAVAGADDERLERVLVVESSVLVSRAGRARARATGILAPARRSRHWGPRGLLGVGVGGIGHLVGGVVEGGVDRGIHRDGQLDVAPEQFGQGLHDHRPQPGLEDVLGEIVGGSDQGGVLDEAQGPGQLDECLLLRREAAVGEAGDRLGPHGGEITGRIHSWFSPGLSARYPQSYPQMWNGFRDHSHPAGQADKCRARGGPV